MRPLIQFLTLALITAPASAGGTLTVDDDGPADFSDIQAAIDAASPGDTILVRAGDYSGFSMSGGLAILGYADEPRPRIAGGVSIFNALGAAAGFTLEGLEFPSMLLFGVEGRGLVQNCRIDGNDFGSAGGGFNLIDSCDQLVIADCEIVGADGVVDSFNLQGRDGLLVLNTRLEIVNSILRGGSGLPFVTTAAGHGISVGVSDVRITSTSLIAGSFGCGPLVCGSEGFGLFVELFGSTVDVRGRSSDLIDGIFANDENTVTYTSNLVVLGVPTGAEAVDPAVILELTGEPQLGQTLKLDLYGPAGESAFVVSSLNPLLLDTAGLADGLAWLDFTAPLTLETFPLFGFGLAPGPSFTIPDSSALIGVEFWVQAAQIDAAGPLRLSNPDGVVVRP